MISATQNTTFKVLYFSDIHAKTGKFARFKTANDEFDRENEGQNTLKLSGGDINFPADNKKNALIIKFLNLIKLDASCIGNHDLECGLNLVDAINIEKPAFSYLSANLDYTRENPFEKEVAKSVIVDKNGEKVGIIGLTAFDSKQLVHKSENTDFVEVKDYAKSIKAVKREVKKLEDNGINKIFLLAHTGEKSPQEVDYYRDLARIGGIDVIIGGHDHYEFDRWYTSARREPVKIVSTEANNDKNPNSSDLGKFGELTATFDKNGVLIPEKSKNIFKETTNYSPDKEIEELVHSSLGDTEIICSTSSALECSQRKTEENPVANMLADSMLWIADKYNPTPNDRIALISSGEIKADLPKGELSLKKIKEAVPFTHQVIIVETQLSKKEIIEALEWGVKTTTFPKQTTGLLQVGGLKYTVTQDNKVKDVFLLNKDGSKGKSFEEMPDDTKINVVYDTFLLGGAGDFKTLQKDKTSDDVRVYPYDHQSGLIHYLEENFKNKPVETTSGRITKES